MRSPAEMQTIQIELTSACVLHCSNCTRFSGTKPKESFISAEDFRRAIDSLAGYAEQPHAIVGFMGGEPLLHPQFREFCAYALTKIPRAHLGLWSTFPDAPKYRAYAEIICETFGVILLNDHSRGDILHAPVLMAAEDHFRKPCSNCLGGGSLVVPYSDENPGGLRTCEVCNGTGSVTDNTELFRAVEHCWVQESWSASINNKGAWFCEVAGALSDLFDGPEGWSVEPGWWKRVPKDFAEQMDWACRRCGAALPIERTHNSQDPRDDVSASNLERLRGMKSKKLARGEFILHDKFKFDPALVNNTYPHQTYKDEAYRKSIARRYGIGLRLDARGFWEPFLLPPGWIEPERPKPLFEIFQEKYGAVVGSR